MELKIDPDFRDLLPHLSNDKFKRLEEMILKEGYDGTPILVWNGYIVDGHHRYKIFTKHNIKFNIEEISLPIDCEKSEIMDWMIAYQDVRRNMCEAEKIYANDKVSMRRIKEENEKKISNGGSVGGQGGYKSQACVHLDAPLNKDRDRTTNTREQRAKLSGVSTGTVARYDTVMNSDNKELKQSMLSGDVKIGTAYKQVISEKKKDNTSNLNKSTSSDSHVNKPNLNSQADEQTKKICEFMKTERKGDYNYNIASDISSLHYIFNKAVNDMNDSIFDNHEMMNIISKKECDILIQYLNESKEKINEIIEKLEEVKSEK